MAASTPLYSCDGLSRMRWMAEDENLALEGCGREVDGRICRGLRVAGDVDDIDDIDGDHDMREYSY